MVLPRSFPKHDVTPAKAGAHLEVPVLGESSGWIPAFAGMTAGVLGDEEGETP
jgi:hypothetical protein